MKKQETNSKKEKKDNKLKINGTLDDVLRAAVKGNPKPSKTPKK